MCSNNASDSSAFAPGYLFLAVKQKSKSEKVPVIKKSENEEAIPSHCSILAWRIPWTEEPSGLQFMKLQIIGHS